MDNASIGFELLSSMISHSSGPSQRAERFPFTEDDFGFAGSGKPTAFDSELTDFTDARKDMRYAGAAGTICTLGPAAILPASAVDRPEILPELAMEAPSVLIDKYRFGDSDLDVAIRHRDEQFLTDPVPAAFDESHGDRVAAVFRPIG